MKQVYLVHKSGERLGPYEMKADWVSFTDPNLGVIPVAQWLLLTLGFVIEDALPEKITLTRDLFMKVARPMDGPFVFENFWRDLCEEAKKGL